MRRISALPNLMTLANAFCGLLAIAKGIDALVEPSLFYAKLETACRLIFLGMVFDALDGKVARITGGSSAFGAQLDSFSDALTFGCAPALLAKVVIEHESGALGLGVHSRLNFIAAAAFALMAILSLARFNLETTPDPAAHNEFKGLPSPAAAGAVTSAILLYLTLRDNKVEFDDGTQTPLGILVAWWPQLSSPEVAKWWLLALVCSLPIYGGLMVSRVRYVHAMSLLTRKGSFFLLVYLVFTALLLYSASSLFLFLAFQSFAMLGLLGHLRRSRRPPDVPDVFDEELVGTSQRP